MCRFLLQKKDFYGILMLYYSSRGTNGGENELYDSKPGGKKMEHITTKSTGTLFRRQN